MRCLLRSLYYLHDKKKITDWEMPFIKKIIIKKAIKKLDGTWIGDIFKELDLI
jgi:oleate hydratase